MHPGPRPGPSEEFVNEFLTQAGRAAPAPQSFRMDSLLKEMQGIQQLPPGAHAQTFEMWRNDFVNQQRDLFDGPSGSQAPGGSQLLMNRPGPSVDTMNWTREFFNEGQVMIDQLITINLTLININSPSRPPQPRQTFHWQPKVSNSTFLVTQEHSSTVNSPTL